MRSVRLPTVDAGGRVSNRSASFFLLLTFFPVRVLLHPNYATTRLDWFNIDTSISAMLESGLIDDSDQKFEVVFGSDVLFMSCNCGVREST